MDLMARVGLFFLTLRVSELCYATFLRGWESWDVTSDALDLSELKIIARPLSLSLWNGHTNFFLRFFSYRSPYIRDRRSDDGRA